MTYPSNATFGQFTKANAREALRLYFEPLHLVGKWFAGILWNTQAVRKTMPKRATKLEPALVENATDRMAKFIKAISAFEQADTDNSAEYFAQALIGRQEIYDKRHIFYMYFVLGTLTQWSTPITDSHLRLAFSKSELCEMSALFRKLGQAHFEMVSQESSALRFFRYARALAMAADQIDEVASLERSISFLHSLLHKPPVVPKPVGWPVDDSARKRKAGDE